MRGVRAILIAAATVAALVALPLAAAAVDATQSAWNDRTYVSATVTAGTWEVPPPSGCTAMSANGEVANGGTCSVDSMTVNQWTDGTNVVRDYFLSVSISEGNGYAAINVDLSKATGTSGTWDWAAAATIPTDQFTPVSGFTCSELPKLRASGPTNWGHSYIVWVRVVENASSPMGAGKNCA